MFIFYLLICLFFCWKQSLLLQQNQEAFDSQWIERLGENVTSWWESAIVDDAISKGNSLLWPLTAMQLIKCSAWPLFLSVLSPERSPQARIEIQFKPWTGRIHTKRICRSPIQLWNAFSFSVLDLRQTTAKCQQKVSLGCKEAASLDKSLCVLLHELTTVLMQQHETSLWS